MLRKFLFVSALALLPATPAMGKGRASTPAQRKAKELSTLKASLKSDPYTAGVLRRSSKSKMIGSVGGKKSRIADRKVWVPLGVDPEIRKLTVGTVLQKMSGASKKLKKAIRKDPDSAVWDVVFVGAGIHTAIAANSLGNKAAPMRMLTIESSSQVANTFRSLGDTLSRNSANRAEKSGAKVERGFGNKNPSVGPWGDPDLSGSEWPGVKGFADVATINLFTSGSDFLMKTKVTKVQERGVRDSWPARYRVHLNDGSKVFTNQVVSGTGIGVPKIPIADKVSLKVVEKTRSKINYKSPNKVPKILTSEEALRLANLSATGRDPYRFAVNGKAPRANKSKGTESLRFLDALEAASDPSAIARISKSRMVFSLAGAALPGIVAAKDVKEYKSKRIANPAGTDTYQVSLTLKNGKTKKFEADSFRLYSGTGAIRNDIQVRTDDLVQNFGIERIEQRPSEFARKLGTLVAPNDVTQLRGATVNFTNGTAAGRQLALNEIKSLKRKSGRKMLGGERSADEIKVTLKNGSSQRFSATAFEVKGAKGSLGKFSIKDLQSSKRPRPRIAVIGGGDSGRTFLEYLYGQAPESAYTGPGKRDSAQRGDIGDVLWVVGESGPKDCGSFLNATRSRYLRLAGKVREADGTKPRAELAQARIEQVREIKSGPNKGKYQLRVGNRVEIVDRVIFATGYENRSLDIFKKGGVGGRANVVKGQVQGLSGTRNLAKKITNQDIYLIGAAAGTGVIGEDEIFNTKENQASLYAYAERDRSLMKVVNEVPRTKAGLDVSKVYRNNRSELRQGESRSTLLRVKASARGKARQFFEPTSMKTVLLKAQIGDVLSGFKFPEATANTMSVSFERLQGGQIQVSSAIDDLSLAKLGKAIEKNPVLSKELKDALGARRSLRVDFGLVEAGKKKGRIALDSLVIAL